MKNCKGCKFAEWDKTQTGRLSQTGKGNCTYKFKVPLIPASMYWVGGAPVTSGGFINRLGELKEHCAYYVREEKAS